jgi:hypothetical protein
MNTILHKVQTYLDKVSREPVVISEELVDAFGESCKAILRKQFSEERQSQFKPRMSNIGRPLCQLQMEAKGIKGEGQPYSNKMRNTFGDLIEALSIFVMKSAGVEIKNEQKEVTHKFGKQSIDGKQDVEIDNKVWDIKSASPYSFEKKFGEDGGFEAVVEEDSFGYATQGYLYADSQKKNFGGWIAINKSTGEWTVCYEAVDETFRGKPTGNKVLGFVCSYCPYKLPCWGSGLKLLPQQQSKGKNPKWVWYTEVNNPKKDETSEFGGE